MGPLRQATYTVQQTKPPLPAALFQTLDDARGLIAHRGGGFRAPENTLVALRQAAEDGAVAVEVDVCLSSDGVPHIIHDLTVDRTTDGHGPVRGFSADGLKKLNAAAKFLCTSPGGAVCQSAQVPTLDELVDEALRLQLGVFLDCKDARTAAHVAEAFKQNELLYDIGCVVSFNPFTLRAVRRMDPRIPIMLTHRHQVLSESLARKKASKWKVWLAGVADRMLMRAINKDLWLSLKACGILLWKNDINEKVVEMWKERGLKVIAWTVNNQADKERLASLGVPCMTDVLTTEDAPEQAD